MGTPWAVTLNGFFVVFTMPRKGPFWEFFYYDTWSRYTPRIAMTWVLRAGKPDMKPIPFFTKSCPTGAYFATSYSRNVTNTHGWKNLLLIMIHEPTVPGGFDGITVLGACMGIAGRPGAVFPHRQCLLPPPPPPRAPPPPPPPLIIPYCPHPLKTVCVCREVQAST